VNQSIRYLLSTTLVLLLTAAPMFPQQASGGARTSVNRGGSNVNTNVNGNKNVNANVNKNYNANVDKNYNVNVNKNYNVNVHKNVYIRGGYHGGYYGGGCCYNPAAVVATTAIVTAAVVGTRVYALPPSCSVMIVNGLTYQRCGSTWYQPQFVGTSTRYVVVVAPR
jgi:hypothetical protein